MNSLFRLFIGIVILSAGVFRTLFFENAIAESQVLGVPFWFAYFIIIFEIVCGIMLIFNLKVKWVLGSVAIFLIIAILVAFIGYGAQLWENAGELFVFDPNPTDIFLHITYLVIIFALLFDKHMGA
ncbi:DoxX family membrane protein [Candidatus Woesearchaeota archaeon]|nr:DoxX family membrane protein [Candidatus Woesearchaeota archaeon]